MWTIGKLAKRFGLARSTLLYYDAIGLLRASERSAANYRLYTAADVERMERIDVYRRAGLPLAAIVRVLDGDADVLAELLERRLTALNREIHQLRAQQRRILDLLEDQAQRRDSRCLDKAEWVATLAATGLGEEEMRRWHVEFERRSPEAHQDFLESLGLDAEEIASIRRWSREGVTGGRPAGGAD